jgi:hypothetical protein
MKILDALRNFRSHSEVTGEKSSSSDAELPIPGYDRLDDKEVGARLHGLSQVELAAVETYERSHKDRREVLAKLHYMHTIEPLPGYDALSAEQIVEVLAGADAETVRAVRDYERKFGHRPQVAEAAARALPTAKPSAAEDRADEEKAGRVREGFAGLDKAARDLLD